MLPHRSRSAAPAAERPFLAPGWLIALLAAIVGLVLFLLYPRTDLERRLAAMPDTALSAAYLANLLRSDPDNPRLRLLLARQQLQMNKPDAARATLQPALDARDEPTRRAAWWILFEITEADYRRLPTRPTAQREALQQVLLRQMQQLAEMPLSVEQQIELAGKAYQYNAPSLGQALFKALANRLDDPAQASALFARAARDALANGDYRGCAELYLLARSSSPDAQQARRHFHAALRALQSGNQPLAALELGERELGDLAEDPDTLLLLTQLSRAAACSSSLCASNGRRCRSPAPGAREHSIMSRKKARRAARALPSTTGYSPSATRCFSKTANSKMPGRWPVPLSVRHLTTSPGARGWPALPNGQPGRRSPSTTG